MTEQSYVKYTDEKSRGWYDVKLCINGSISNVSVIVVGENVEIPGT